MLPNLLNFIHIHRKNINRSLRRLQKRK